MFLIYTKRLILVAFILILLMLISGITYEKTSEYFDSKKYQPPGKIININNHNMHIFTKGSGKATVVFISGFGTPSPYADFYPLYSEISKHAGIAVYERPGYGWSDIAKTPRDIDTITEEIHQLFTKSKQKPPYIFVAHSLGSLEAIRYTQKYREEVMGMVTIDAGNPDFYSKGLSGSISSNNSLKLILNKIGIFRLLFNNDKFYNATIAERNYLKLLPEDLKKVDTVMYLKTMINKNKIDEDKSLVNNALKVSSGGTIGNIPLTILTSEIEAANNKDWEVSQKAFRNWSAKSKQIIVKNSGHYIHHYAPEVVNNEILDMIKN